MDHRRTKAKQVPPLVTGGQSNRVQMPDSVCWNREWWSKRGEEEEVEKSFAVNRPTTFRFARIETSSETSRKVVDFVCEFG